MKLFDDWIRLEKGEEGVHWFPSGQAWVPWFELKVELQGQRMSVYILSLVDKEYKEIRKYRVPKRDDMSQRLSQVLDALYEQIRTEQEELLEHRYGVRMRHGIPLHVQDTKVFCIGKPLTLTIDKDTTSAQIGIGLGVE